MPWVLQKGGLVMLFIQNVCQRFIPMDGHKEEFQKIAMIFPKLIAILIVNTWTMPYFLNVYYLFLRNSCLVCIHINNYIYTKLYMYKIFIGRRNFLRNKRKLVYKVYFKKIELLLFLRLYNLSIHMHLGVWPFSYLHFHGPSAKF